MGFWDHRSISIDRVTGDNRVDADENANLTISGRSRGYDPGEDVTIKIFDKWHNLLGTYTAEVDEDGNWSTPVDALPSDGSYFVKASIGSPHCASHDHEHFKVDTTPPTVTINPVTSDNIVAPFENDHGFKVTGSATGAEGRQIIVEIVDPDTDTVIATKTAIVHHGKWKVKFEDIEEFDFPDQYTVRAKVEDAAGNEGSAEHDFATLCFMAGTMIRTPNGEVAVETLKRGDRVLTSDGRAVPITWLGQQTVSTVFGDPLRVLPIRIKAGALAETMPARDLLVSPDHALFVGGLLVQAGALLNGTSIVREKDVPQTFTYYHVEVDDHSLIFAENVPAETFIDNVDRLAFDNWDEHEALYPQGKPIVEMPYPRAKAQRQIPRALREQLAARARRDAADVASAA